MLNPVILTSVLGFLFFLNINFAMAILLALLILVHLATSLYFARRVDKAEEIHGEARSTLSGKIVDSLTNNFAVNLFYRFKDENAFIRSTKPKRERLIKKLRLPLRSCACSWDRSLFSSQGLG